MVAPVRQGPNAAWAHFDLYQRVRNALHALPSRFRTSLRVAGISAVDLFTLNTPLGAAIEQSVVDSLNQNVAMRRALELISNHELRDHEDYSATKDIADAALRLAR